MQDRCSTFHLLVLLALVFVSCQQKQHETKENVQIAFMADVHLQDIYGTFSDTDYRGIKNPSTGKYNTIRTMDAQLHSTRIFNENYFAFLAALDDVVKKGIKLVVLPGDFSDDGQPMNIKALRKILDKYTREHGIVFFAITGNHDPVRPFAQDGGKTDFLGEDGKEQPIMSAAGIFKPTSEAQLEPIITSDIKKWGYKGILGELSNFGFFPKRQFLYWETPFSNYNYNNYTFEEAWEEATLEKREYPLQEHGPYVTDVSYLVEPIEGVWLLALDANVYVPRKEVSGVSDKPYDFTSAGIGYNKVLTHKRHLLEWVQKVTRRAKELGKTVVVFSHYPMVEFNDDASDTIKTLFGDDKMQLHRVPNEDVAQVFADLGIKIHFGGHMHINDTGVRTTEKGNTLFNIQTPSLAAYMPAYKILSIHSNEEMVVETVVLDSVPGFDELFPLYEKEYAHLRQMGDRTIWNREILTATTYKEFTQWHLRELVRLRFLPKDWPAELADLLMGATGKDLLLIERHKMGKSTVNPSVPLDELTLEEFGEWTGFDMVYDYYRLRSADELALSDIGVRRLEQYILVCKYLENTGNPSFGLWAKIFRKASTGQPSNYFKINLKSSSIQRMHPRG